MKLLEHCAFPILVRPDMKTGRWQRRSGTDGALPMSLIWRMAQITVSMATGVAHVGDLQRIVNAGARHAGRNSI